MYLFKTFDSVDSPCIVDRGISLKKVRIDRILSTLTFFKDMPLIGLHFTVLHYRSDQISLIYGAKWHGYILRGVTVGLDTI